MFGNKKDENTQLEVIETPPTNLIESAIQRGVDIDKLDKLFDLQERWEKRQAKKAFLSAMSLFQSECPVLEKSKKVAFQTTKGSVNYSYSPLGGIAKSIKGTLITCGLSYRWEMQEKDTTISVTCIISHLDGHSEKTTMSGQLDSSGSKNAIQQRGSTITYLQRYTLIGALGISTADMDNDGQGSDKPKQTPKKPELTPKHERWAGAKQAIQEGSITLDQVKDAYTLSVAKEKELLTFKKYDNEN